MTAQTAVDIVYSVLRRRPTHSPTPGFPDPVAQSIVDELTAAGLLITPGAKTRMETVYGWTDAAAAAKPKERRIRDWVPRLRRTVVYGPWRRA